MRFRADSFIEVRNRNAIMIGCACPVNALKPFRLELGLVRSLIRGCGFAATPGY